MSSSLSQNEDLERVFRVRTTLLEMLEERGYIVGEKEKSVTLDAFKKEYKDTSRDNVTLFGTKGSKDPEDRILVFFCEDKKLKTSDLKMYESRMIEGNVTRAIIVYQVSITSLVKQTFMEAELLVNITKHRYVPRHQVLSSKEKATLLKKYHLKETQLPRMQRADAIARFYGLRPGQVVKIYRQSETAGRYVTYRIVL
eukprot:jgi/Bigna1/67463/fgenesh1_pg.3_\